MSQAPSAPETPQVSPLGRGLAAIIMAVPVVGILVHAAFFLYGVAHPGWLHDYVYGPWLKYLVAPLSFANLVANWIHYRRTWMRLDIAARIMTYLWIISYVLLFLYCKRGM